MKYARTVTIVFFMIFLTALSGCNSKKEKVGQPSLKKADQVTPSPHSSGAIVAVPQDEVDVVAVKTHIFSLVKDGNFSAIYKDASAGFREVGPEQQFVAMWQNQLMETGAFKGAKEVSHTVRPEDKSLVFIYDVQYEKKHKALRLTFRRSEKRVLELTGINQKDLPKTGT